MKTNTISGIPVVVLLDYGVIPNWLIQLARPNKGQEFVFETRRVEDVRFILRCTMPLVSIAFFILGGYVFLCKDAGVSWTMSLDVTWFICSITFATLGKLSEYPREWVQRLQSLEEYLHDPWLIRKFNPNDGIEAPNPLKGIYLLAKVQEDEFKEVFIDFLNQTAYKVVLIQKLDPSSVEEIKSCRDKFQELILTLKDLGVTDGNWKPHFDWAENEYLKGKTLTTR